MPRRRFCLSSGIGPEFQTNKSRGGREAWTELQGFCDAAPRNCCWLQQPSGSEWWNRPPERSG